MGRFRVTGSTVTLKWRKRTPVPGPWKSESLTRTTSCKTRLSEMGRLRLRTSSIGGDTMRQSQLLRFRDHALCHTLHSHFNIQQCTHMIPSCT